MHLRMGAATYVRDASARAAQKRTRTRIRTRTRTRTCSTAATRQEHRRAGTCATFAYVYHTSFKNEASETYVGVFGWWRPPFEGDAGHAGFGQTTAGGRARVRGIGPHRHRVSALAAPCGVVGGSTPHAVLHGGELSAATLTARTERRRTLRDDNLRVHVRCTRHLELSLFF